MYQTLGSRLMFRAVLLGSVVLGMWVASHPADIVAMIDIAAQS